MINTVCIAVLILIILILIFCIFLIRCDLVHIREELDRSRDEGNNQHISVTLIDSKMEALAAAINRNIDYQNSLKLETARSRRELEQSISDIAHDLRTPITVVKGNLQMLEKEELSEKGRQCLKVCNSKSDSLKNMVDEFFELSLLESDNQPVELTAFDIVPFLAEFVVENEMLIKKHELDPEIILPEHSIYIYANKNLLIRVLGNIMGNVMKYAEKSFMIKISDTDSGCLLRIGNPVKMHQQIDVEHIFDRTYRADKARTDGSAGLGMYIAKLLMEKQKGSISACMEGDKLYFDIFLPEAENKKLH